MDGSACGTMPRLPALSPRRVLDNLRERFAALRGTGGPVRLLVDDRPEDDRRHHLEGAIAGQIRGVETENRTLATFATAGRHGDRRLVRAWTIAPPATAKAVAAACNAAGAATHPTLVAAGLVGETLLPASAAWSAALAATSSGGAVRLVAKPHAMGDAEIVLPERGLPASGPWADFSAALAGAELTPDRLFVVEDVVEASIVLLDRLVEGLTPPASAPPAAPPADPAANTPPRRGKARQSVDVDALLLRLVKSVSKKCRDEDLESFLDREVRSKGSEDLSEMLQEHLGEDVSPQTIRRKVDGKGSPHASKLYAEWKRPPAHPGDARDLDDDVQRNSAPMSDRDAQVDEMRRSGSITKRSRRRS